MPIEKPPRNSGSQKSSGSTGSGADPAASLSPLERYLAKQKESQGGPAQGTAAPSPKGAAAGTPAQPSRKSAESAQETVKRFFDQASRKFEELRNQASSSFDLKSQPQSQPQPQPQAQAKSQQAPSASAPSEPSSQVQGPPRIPAEFGPRFGAYVIDLVILFSIYFAVRGPLFSFFAFFLGGAFEVLREGLEFILFHLVIFVYFGWFYAEKGASPGKLLLNLEVVDAHGGGKLNWVRTFFREALGKYISAIVLFIGFLIALFRDDRKALHDMIFDTKVVRRRA